MKIEEYIKTFKLNKYEIEQINSISREFKDRRLEKFLLVEYREELEYTHKTELMVLEFCKNKVEQIHKILRTINNEILKYNKNDYVCLFFSYMPSEKYYIACEVAKKAYYNEILPNIYDDDDSKNHIVVFKKTQVKEISLLWKLIMQRGTSKDILIGYRIYGIDISYIVNLCMKNNIPICYKKPNILTHFCGNQIRKDNNVFRIIETRNVIEQIMIKQDFRDELELSYYLRENIMMPIQNMYNDVLDIRGNIDYIEEKNKIYNVLVKENRVPVKWKSERAMFDLLYSCFPDAIYQYRPKWLAPQSLDVFVPSINTGFEYQGVQHFSSINFFGGENGFNKRIALDKKKKEICKKQGINLLEWGYQETITKTVLKNKLKGIGIKL